jgi:DNA-binding response OmpR family regulator
MVSGLHEATVTYGGAGRFLLTVRCSHCGSSLPHGTARKEWPVARILIAEDDPLIGSFIEKGLRASGFMTLLADDGERAQHLSLTDEFDLLILDMGLPEREGFHVLQELRSRGKTMPVLVLTGRGDRDAAACLDAGADDFMRKPFHFDELLARVRTRLRDGAAEHVNVLRAGTLKLDTETRRAYVGEEAIDLTSREASLLEMFMRHADQILSREQLLSQVWGFSFDPTTNLVNVYILSLRKKLGSDVIETVRGVGYRLRAS